MNKPSPKTAVINKSWLQLTDSLSNNYHNKWICDESWCRIMCSQFPHLLGAFSLKRTNLVQCILRMVGGFDTQNANGVYHKAFKSVCPYGGSRRTVHYFFRHKVGPPQNDMSKAPTCAYYESLFNQREHFNEKEEEDRDHAHLQRVNKNSNCEIIERGDLRYSKRCCFCQ